MLLKRLHYLLLAMSLFMAYQAKTGDYVPVTDPLVKQKLEKWRDLKFGLMMHWGPYSQIGVVESWSICSEAQDWISRPMVDYEEYKQFYRSLGKVFNPVKFDPGKWASAAKDAGMKYIIFTTKHHDGFCMFDTRQTDYKITAEQCPFHTHPLADITRSIFDAFRQQDFMIGAYFSKPDWNCQDYWCPYYATPDRHVNYDPAKHPGKWQRFKDFTYNQIEELMTRYGEIDILWLDGAWVRPIEKMPQEYEEWAKKKNWNQDIDMGRIVRMARGHQPGLIVVDRWVAGEYENYLTPEQTIPQQPLEHPWESCITMSGGWSYSPNQTFKSLRQLIFMLVDIVAKGGNLLLNIGPAPDGTWPDEVYQRLAGIGEWIHVNGEAIYGSSPLAPFKEKNVCFTQQKDGSRYAIYLAEGDQQKPPAEIRFSASVAPNMTSARMLGVDRELHWQKTDNEVVIQLPDIVRDQPPCQHAWTIKLSFCICQ
jgi:alpha-L-fucosidase